MPRPPSRANLADPLTKELERSAAPRLEVCMDVKRPLRLALRTGNAHLKGVRQRTKSQEGVRKCWCQHEMSACLVVNVAQT
jgi:hypothetical protein